QRRVGVALHHGGGEVARFRSVLARIERLDGDAAGAVAGGGPIRLGGGAERGNGAQAGDDQSFGHVLPLQAAFASMSPSIFCRTAPSVSVRLKASSAISMPYFSSIANTTLTRSTESRPMSSSLAAGSSLSLSISASSAMISISSSSRPDIQVSSEHAPRPGPARR